MNTEGTHYCIRFSADCIVLEEECKVMNIMHRAHMQQTGSKCVVSMY